jgi:AraC family ethanolamine operon transcriptional activator
MTSIDEFVDPVATAHMHPMVLKPGAMRAEVVTVDVRGVLISMGEYSFPVATRGETLANRVAILTPFDRIPLARVNGEPAARGVAHAFGSVAEVAASTAGPTTQFATMSFPPEALERAARVLDVEIDLPGRGEYHPVHTGNPARAGRLLSALRQSVRETGKVASSVREAAAIAHALVEIGVHYFAADGNCSALTPSARLNSVHIVRVCEEFAIASNFHSVTLGELCRASGVSERRVRQAFYECYGISPTAYLRIAALNEVRRALLEEPPARDAVSRAASDFGFWHLSRFAGQYRALFGEPPSATFAGRRANGAAG